MKRAITSTGKKANDPSDKPLDAREARFVDEYLIDLDPERAAVAAGYLHFLHWMEDQQYLWGEHFLPHDGEQKRQQRQMEADPTRDHDMAVASPVMILREMRPTWTWRIVPRVSTIQQGIDALRIDFSTYCFDETACKEGIAHLENYSREWNSRLQVWSDHPRHHEHSHAADAIRQKAQGYAPDRRIGKPGSVRKRPRATVWTA